MKNWKRMLGLLLTAAMLLGLLPAGVLAADSNAEITEDAAIEGVETKSLLAAASGNCGEHLTWSLNDNVLTISGYGPMWDYYGTNLINPFDSCRTKIKSIVIQSGVTSIGSNAFLPCTRMTKISIPNTVTSIGEGAFFECSNLLDVVIPDSVTSIGFSAFYGCSSIRSVTLPKSITTIPSHAFYGCKHLKTIEIPGRVTTIGRSAFENCGQLDWITIPSGVTSIESAVFQGCEGLKHVSYGGSLENWKAISISTYNEQLANATFQYWTGTVTASGICGNNMTWKIENHTLTVFGSGPMVGYENNYSAPWSFFSDEIEHLVLSPGITEIGKYAFANSEKLVDVSIPNTVSVIGDYSFVACDKLTGVTIPSGVTTIGAVAFNGCVGLSSVAIADSVTTIGERAFFLCVSLTDVYYSGSEEAWKNISMNQDFYLTSDRVTRHYNSALSPFSDVQNPSSWEYFPVLWAVSQNITNGTSETTFSPDAACTRAQAVTFLWRAAGSLEPTSASNPFVDVSEGDYYYKAVLWAVEKGITTGTDATHFGPDATCNRAQIVTFLHRYEGSPAASGESFNDVPASEYYYVPVIWAVSKGVTNGTGEGSFSPMADCTRGQIVTFLYRDMVG